MFNIPLDPYIFKEMAEEKSMMRKRLDMLLDKLDDKDLSILEATATALCKVKEPEE